jgi:hypothetical protein
MMKLNRLAVAMALACGTAGSMAAMTTISGANFDISFDDGVVGLFGTPTLVGDVLSWLPSGLNAHTAKGIDFAHATFAFTITAHDGFQLDSFDLHEGGSYFYFGGRSRKGWGTGVAAAGLLSVTPAGAGSLTEFLMPDASFKRNGRFDFSPRSWSGSTSEVDLLPATTMASVSVQTLLAAYASPGGHGWHRRGGFPSYAFIDTSGAFLDIEVSAIPEPGTFALMLAGMAAVGFVAARRRRAD